MKWWFGQDLFLCMYIVLPTQGLRCTKWRCIFQASQVEWMQGEFILLVNILRTIPGCRESFLSPGDPWCEKNRECICALVLGSIFSYVILGKLSVIKLCWPIPKVITALTCSRWGVSPELGIVMSKKRVWEREWIMKVYMNHQYCSFEENKENGVMLCLNQRTVGERYGELSFSLLGVYFRALLFRNDV